MMDVESKVISREINQLLWKAEKTLSTAESCTGGRVAEAIITVPGSSVYFKGGIISYTNEIKEKLLGVSHELLEEKTAVCEEVAKAMVQGAIKAMDTTYAIAVSGIAGPGGGSPEIPVGTIWIACGSADNIITAKLTEDEGRDQNQSRATQKALQMFLGYLKENLPKDEEE
jgi:nicotinamide-nucleotide amidase